MRQNMNELKLGSRVTVMPLGLVGVGVHDGHPVYHVGVGKQRNAAYIGNKQYRQKISRDMTKQPVHSVLF